MTETSNHHLDTHGSGAAHGSPPRPTGWHRWTGPGWLRALWTTPAFGFFWIGFACLVRWAAHWHPIWKTVPLVTIGTVSLPLGFLIGIGVFDYWAYYFSGRPTRPEDHSGHGARGWRDYFRPNTDHKVIGLQYLVATGIFFLIGGLLALLARAELAHPGDQYFNPQTFNVLISEHAALMIFAVVVPVFAGLGNFVIPLMIGAGDMAFPRLNALSFWLLPIGGVVMLSGMFAPGGGPSAGWTCYAPLCTHQPMGELFYNMGVQWAGASSILTALNFLVTIITMRAPGMTFWRMPLLVWANFATSTLVVLATPFIAGSQFFVLFDRVMHTNFFETANGGYVLGYQHIFWFYSHPAVYIMILPGFGIVSEVISVMSRKPIFGYRLMALSLLGILILGFTVWAHHMFVSGMAPWLRVPIMITTLLIAIPTGIKIFSWLATMWNGRIHFTVPMLWAVGFIAMFTIGGLSGIYLGSVPIDIMANQTYFIVAHIRRLLLVPEDERAHVQRAAREAPLLGDVHRVQPHLLPHALPRAAGHAAPRRRLREPLRRPEPVHLDRILRPRRLDPDLRLQHGLVVEARRGRRGEPVACAHAGVAGQLAASDLQLRQHPAGRRRPLRVRRPRRPPRDSRHAGPGPGRQLVAWFTSS